MITILKGKDITVEFVNEDRLPPGVFTVASETEVVYYVSGKFVVVPMESVNIWGTALVASGLWKTIQEIQHGHSTAVAAGDRSTLETVGSAADDY